MCILSAHELTCIPSDRQIAPPITSMTSHGKTDCKLFQSIKCLYDLPLNMLSLGQTNNRIMIVAEIVESFINLSMKR